MYINVIYSKKIPFCYIRIKSTLFFGGTEFIQRNSVFSHNKEDSVVALNKNRIHIYVPDDNTDLQNLVARFLRSLFGGMVIGINGISEKNLQVFSSLNYVLM